VWFIKCPWNKHCGLNISQPQCSLSHIYGFYKLETSLRKRLPTGNVWKDQIPYPDLQSPLEKCALLISSLFIYPNNSGKDRHRHASTPLPPKKNHMCVVQWEIYTRTQTKTRWCHAVLLRERTGDLGAPCMRRTTHASALSSPLCRHHAYPACFVIQLWVWIW
jgi:hypothetical protein